MRRPAGQLLFITFLEEINMAAKGTIYGINGPIVYIAGDSGFQMNFRKKVLPLTAPPWIPYNNLSLCVLLSCFCFLSLALFSLDDSVCHLGNDKLNGSDSIIITRNYIIKLVWVTVCICNTD